MLLMSAPKLVVPLILKIAILLEKVKPVVVMSGHQTSFHIGLSTFTRDKKRQCIMMPRDAVERAIPEDSNNSTALAHNSGGWKS